MQIKEHQSSSNLKCPCCNEWLTWTLKTESFVKHRVSPHKDLVDSAAHLAKRLEEAKSLLDRWQKWYESMYSCTDNMYALPIETSNFLKED